MIKRTRLGVSTVLGHLAAGASVDEILDEYEGLEITDIQACLRYAANAIG